MKIDKILFLLRFYKKDFPYENEKLRELLHIYISENHPKILKTDFPDRWKFLSKNFAYPYEYFNSISDYQKPVNNIKKKDFFNRMKNNCRRDNEIEKN